MLHHLVNDVQSLKIKMEAIQNWNQDVAKFDAFTGSMLARLNESASNMESMLKWIVSGAGRGAGRVTGPDDDDEVDVSVSGSDSVELSSVDSVLTCIADHWREGGGSSGENNGTRRDDEDGSKSGNKSQTLLYENPNIHLKYFFNITEMEKRRSIRYKSERVVHVSLMADTRLYTFLCRSISRLVGLSISPSVTIPKYSLFLSFF